MPVSFVCRVGGTQTPLQEGCWGLWLPALRPRGFLIKAQLSAVVRPPQNPGSPGASGAPGAWAGGLHRAQGLGHSPSLPAAWEGSQEALLQKLLEAQQLAACQAWE